MLGRLFYLHFLVLVGVIDIQNRLAVQGLAVITDKLFAASRASFCQKSIQNLRDILLSVVSDCQIDARIRLKRFLSGLHITAHRHDDRLGILLLCAVQHLPALAVGNVGHRAGVYNIHICLLVKRHDLIPLLHEALLHHVDLICIYLAA